MFLHVSVILPGDVHGEGDVCGGAHAWQGVCMVGGMAGGHVWQGHAWQGVGACMPHTPLADTTAMAYGQ